MIKNTKMELDLNNPAVVEKLLNADVVGGFPKKEAQQIEEKIKKAQKSSTFFMKLSVEAIEILQRLAAARRIDWKEYLRAEVESKIINQKIGGPSIQTPSIGLEPTKKIGGPSPNSKIRRIG